VTSLASEKSFLSGRLTIPCKRRKVESKRFSERATRYAWAKEEGY
jgi:hypothetical protein